jgi:hypothetical protein
MHKTDWTIRALLLAIVALLGLLILQPFFKSPTIAYAQSSRFDHVVIASTVFLYKGQQGMLVLDKRNGNVWFFPRVNEAFQDPLFVMRVQFEKIDQGLR